MHNKFEDLSQEETQLQDMIVKAICEDNGQLALDALKWLISMEEKIK